MSHDRAAVAGAQPGGVAETALEHLARGDAQTAWSMLQQHLRDTPQDAEALHAMACVARAGGQAAAAIALAGRAIALEAEPHFHITLGLALQEAGQHEAARAALQVAVLATPQDPRAQDGLAVALESLGRIAEAEQALRAALTLRPLEVERHLALAAFLSRHGRGAEGLEYSTRALRLDPAHVAGSNLHGMLLERCGRMPEAEPHFRTVAAALPKDAAALANHGASLFATRDYEAAQDVLAESLRIADGSPETHTTMGLVLMAQGVLDKAEHALATACRLRADDARLMLNHAGVLADLGQRAQARALLLQAESVATNPLDRARARMNRGVLALAEGDFAQGWPLFEARQALLPLPPALAGLAQWDGAARSTPVLLYAEQGLGDTLHFLRYVGQVAQRAPVLLLVQPALQGLVQCLAPSWAGRVRVLEDVMPDWPVGCVRCSLLSLPLLLGVSRPSAWGVPALRSSQGQGQVGFRLGLCWSGHAGYQFDRRRSLNPALLAPLAGMVGMNVQALQPVGEKLPFACTPLVARDVLATARLIAGLDMVITVDTMVAHLSGLIGVPTVLLDRFGGDWRWAKGSVFLRPDDGGVASQWYPAVRIIRQTTFGVGDAPWQQPVAQVHQHVRDAILKNGKGGCRV